MVPCMEGIWDQDIVKDTENSWDSNIFWVKLRLSGKDLNHSEAGAGLRTAQPLCWSPKKRRRQSRKSTQQMTLKRMDKNTSPDLAPLHSHTKDYTVWQHLYFFNVQKYALRIISLDSKYWGAPVSSHIVPYWRNRCDTPNPAGSPLYAPLWTQSQLRAWFWGTQ